MPKTIFTGENQHVVQTIKAARLKAGLRQSDLAKILGKDQSWVSLVERSQRRLDVVEFIIVAKALNIKPEVLFADLLARLSSEQH